MLENFENKLGPKEAKELEKSDMMAAAGLGSFIWMFDGVFPSDPAMPAGTNMKGFKGKAVMLWPFQIQGKHVEKEKIMKGWPGKVLNGFAKVLKTTPVDSYLMDDNDVADQIMSCFRVSESPTPT